MPDGHSDAVRDTRAAEGQGEERVAPKPAVWRPFEGADFEDPRRKRARSWWNVLLAGPFGYFALVILLAALPYPLQRGRHWASAIFAPPAYLNRDAPEWIAMAQTTPFLSNAAPMRVARPLYPYPAYMIRRSVDPSILSTARIYRILNIAWFLLAAALLRWWTLRWTHDPWAALAAGAMFAASSFVQIYLTQPVPEMLGAAASIGILCVAARAAGWRSAALGRPLSRREKARRRKNWKPWVGAGALTALLMLGKELYALYVCLFLIAVWRRAWRPLFGFAFAALAVHFVYFLWVRWGLGRPYSPYGGHQQGFVTWVFQDLLHRPIRDQIAYLAKLLARIVFHTAEAFWVWPVVLAVIGVFRLAVRPHLLDFLAFCIGYVLLFIATNIVTPRMCYAFFFPVILPAAGAGLVGLLGKARDRRHPQDRRFWYVLLAIGLLLGILVDPFWIFYYG